MLKKWTKTAIKRGMVDIQNLLNAPYDGQSYESLDAMLDQAYVELSPWGSFDVYAVGYTGSVSLYDLAQKISTLSQFQQSIEESAFGSCVEKKMWNLYTISRDYEDKCNCIIRFFIDLISCFTDFGSAPVYNILNQINFGSRVFKQAHISRKTPLRGSTDIETILNAPYDDQSYANLAAILDQPYIELTFWGARNVYAVGYTGSISLWDLAQKVIDLINANPNYSRKEQAHGFQIENKIWDLLKINGQQETKCNFLTNFFLCLIDCFTPYSSCNLYHQVLDAQHFSSAQNFGHAPKFLSSASSSSD